METVNYGIDKERYFSSRFIIEWPVYPLLRDLTKDFSYTHYLYNRFCIDGKFISGSNTKICGFYFKKKNESIDFCLNEFLQLMYVRKFLSPSLKPNIERMVRRIAEFY